jgi:hypothetical protein
MAVAEPELFRHRRGRGVAVRAVDELCVARSAARVDRRVVDDLQRFNRTKFVSTQPDITYIYNIA